MIELAARYTVARMMERRLQPPFRGALISVHSSHPLMQGYDPVALR
jgi:hypothetical protein